jgi:hypothetical protein
MIKPVCRSGCTNASFAGVNLGLTNEGLGADFLDPVESIAENESDVAVCVLSGK